MIKIGLCGLGTVGQGVYNILTTNPYFKERVEIKKILVHSNKKRNVPDELLTLDYKEIVEDPEIDLVIEVIGGTTLAYDIISEALSNKKDVVTANKAVLALHLDSLNNLAKKNNMHLYFEASVCGALPVIGTVLNMAESDEITSMSGIINGSTNYILTKTSLGTPFGDAMSEAKEKGFLEADPTDDVAGFDAMRKIIILSKLAYGATFDITKIKPYRMDNLSDDLINYAKSLGKKIKYVAESKILNSTLELSIEPCAIDNESKLSLVNFEKNYLEINSKYAKTIGIEGYGAGMYPTASAVVLDLYKYTRNEFYSLNFEKSLELSEISKHSYIFDLNCDIDEEYILKKDKNIVISKPIDRATLDSILNSAKCFAKLD